jgi:4-hydroxybutyrate CoA-transferase
MSGKIRVKYCGGCNPRYDRTAVTARLRAAFPLLEVAESPGGDADLFVAVVCGCPSACAEHEHLRGLAGKMVLTCGEDYEKLAGLIRDSICSRLAGSGGDFR